MESSKLLQLSQITKCGGYVKADLDLTIWLLEQCDTHDSKKELGLLYLESKYDVCLDKIVDLLSVDHYYCKFILALIYFNNEKYGKLYHILNYVNIIDDYIKIQDRCQFDKLLLYMGLYELDENPQKSRKYFVKMDGILHFLLYLYDGEILENAINNGDLYSYYLSGNIDHKKKFIENFSEKFYINYFTEKLGFYFELDKLPTSDELLETFNKSLIEIETHSIKSLIEIDVQSIKNNTFKQFDNRLQIDKYKCETIEDKYNIGLIGLYARLDESEKYYNYMYISYENNYLDSRYYLALMYYYGYGTNKNNEICYELLSKCDSDTYTNKIYYYLLQTSNNENLILLLDKYYKSNCKFEIDKNQLINSYQKLYIANFDIIHLLKNECNNIDLFYDLIVNNYKQQIVNNNYIQIIDYFITIKDIEDSDKLGEIYYVISYIYIYGYINDLIRINKDVKKGINILLKAVQLNNKESIDDYIYLLINGTIINKDYIKAYELLNNNNNHWVYVYFLYNGIIEKKNQNKAIEILKKLDDSYSLFLLGLYTDTITNIIDAAHKKNRYALIYLVKYYDTKNDEDNCMKYIKMAINNNILDASTLLERRNLIIKDNDAEYNEMFWKDS